MRLLVLSRYDETGASSRYRAFQYFPYLKKRGVKISSNALLDQENIKKLFAGEKKSFWYLLKRYAKRIFFLLRNRSKFDLAFITDGELLPYVPYWIEKFFLPKRYVVDYDDAIFHYYDLSKNKLVRWLLAKKIQKVMRGSAAVIAGNDYIKKYALKSGAKRITIIPTVIDSDLYAPAVAPNTYPPVKIGWVGSQTTVVYLGLIDLVLQEISKDYPIELHVIGGRHSIDGVKTVEEDFLKGWNAADELEMLQKIDIGIMPLVDAPWERGKCGFKLVKYMACGKPVIASPVGMNVEIVDEDQNGYLVDSMEDWKGALVSLIQNPQKREFFGRAAREKCLKQYSLSAMAPVLYEVFERIVNRP